MITLRQINNFSIYSLSGLVATACPVLAQGEKVVELDQASKVGETIVFASSGLFAIVTVILYGLTLRKSISEGPSALAPTVFIAFLGLLIPLSSLVTGQLTQGSIVAITVQLGIFIGILIVQLKVAILHR